MAAVAAVAVGFDGKAVVVDIAAAAGIAVAAAVVVAVAAVVWGGAWMVPLETGAVQTLKEKYVIFLSTALLSINVGCLFKFGSIEKYSM